jgi:hypothetical protein
MPTPNNNNNSYNNNNNSYNNNYNNNNNNNNNYSTNLKDVDVPALARQAKGYLSRTYQSVVTSQLPFYHPPQMVGKYKKVFLSLYYYIIYFLLGAAGSYKRNTSCV